MSARAEFSNAIVRRAFSCLFVSKLVHEAPYRDG